MERRPKNKKLPYGQRRVNVRKRERGSKNAPVSMTTISNNIISIRRHDLDNLKTFLSSLVVVHHTAIPYGGSPVSYIRSAIIHGPSPTLLAFKSVNQSFFMGMLFWMSGRITTQSLAKSPPGGFLRDKIIRLGVPTVFYTQFIIPAVPIVALRSWDAQDYPGHRPRVLV
jgi:glucan biosynthesis protein C